MDPINFEASLELATRVEDVWRQMVLFARERSIPRIAYHHLPPPAAPDAALVRIENEGFGEALLAQYLAARTGGIAALANLLQQSVRPVYLDELASLAELGPREREHLAAYRAAGVANGLGIQAFGPHGRNGIFAIDLGPDRPRLAPDALAELRWACQAMHLRYSALLVPTLGEVPALSPREAEVLLWVARGKSNAAIGDILGISAHTVDAHLRRVFLKLGVFDRISAALRGLGFGLISLD
jgi:DNA-binding CsgD family transcriptional regulator